MVPKTVDEIDLTGGSYKQVSSNYIFSKKLCAVSEGAEMWFRRIFQLCDDFGNLYANPELNIRVCAGYRKVQAKKVEKWLQELADKNIIGFYTVNGEKFLHIFNYFPRVPATAKNGRRVRKYPPPEQPLVLPGETGGIQGSLGLTGGHKNKDQNQNEDNDKKDISRAMQGRIVFSLWQTVHDHPKADFDEKRQRAVDKRLKAGDSIEKLHKSIIGYRIDPWRRDKGPAAHEFELICRDAKHVEQGLVQYEKVYGAVYPPPEARAVESSPLTFHSDVAAFVQEQCVAGTGSVDLLVLVSEKFGTEQVDFASRMVDLFNQAKADLG